MIEVFRPGTSHLVNGITCERDTVNEFGFEHLLKTGWFLTPEECYPKKITEKAPEVADSKVTVPEKLVTDQSPKTEKPDKTTTKTAAKK
jgi:hypothetical protein